MFFSFDGIDGVGKSTQMQLFQQWLVDEGHEVVSCRDPGSTPLGERLREIVLHSDEKTSIAPISEMLIYMAARAQLVEEVIRPALDSGKAVVSDRYLLANIVYQGYAGGLDVEAVRQVGQIATASLKPDCVFLLDMDPLAARSRMGEDLDRMEQRGDSYRQKLREGFLTEAGLTGNSVHVINADRSIELIQDEIRAIAGKVLTGEDQS
ncbi:dTMP kinase [Bythopirellula polymerisocia]|nr:dTMP kinase [Bythopirellula polymerisocia]